MQMDTKMGKVIYAIGSHPWHSYLSFLLAAPYGGLSCPVCLSFGRPVRARVMDTWLTPPRCAFGLRAGSWPV